MNKSKGLSIAPNITLPRDFATQTQVILGRKGSGKTNTSVVQAEEMLELGQQIIVADPTGAWWGLKSSRDGKSAGYPVYVFGGEHGDVPLEESAGEQIADAIASGGFSAILDTSLLRKAASQRFMAAFLETLYRINRDAVHLFVDEADLVAPQKPFGEEARVLGAMQDIVRRGRIRGIGCTMISQRPQVLNKDVLSQADVLCVLQMSHNREIAAVREWVDVHATPDESRVMMQSLPSLKRGTAWVWAPMLNLLVKDQVRERRTFDSSATPEVGQKTVRPQVLAQVDLNRLTETIKATVQAAEDNSPKRLRARIAELEARLAAPQIDRKLLDEAELQREQCYARSTALEWSLKDLAEALQELCGRVEHVLEQSVSQPALPAPQVERKHRLPEPAETAVQSFASPSAKAGGTDLKARILRSLAEFASIGRHQIPRSTLSAWAEARGGHFANTLGSMRSAGLLDYPSGGMVSLTPAGRAVAPAIAAPPTSKELFEACIRQAGSGLPERILRGLLNSYPRDMSREDLSAIAGARGGHFSNTLGSLRTAGFLEYPSSGRVRLADWTVTL